MSGIRHSRVRVVLLLLICASLGTACRSGDISSMPGLTDGRQPTNPSARPLIPVPGPVTVYVGLVGTASFAFYQDSSFVLQASSLQYGAFRYLGAFSRRDSVIALNFFAVSALGRWEATARIRGDTLFVTYNDVMAWNDFENAAFVRAR